MADIIKSLHPFCIHGGFHDEPFVDDPELFINIPAFKLVPCKRFHLVAIMCIDLTGLILIRDQIRIEKRALVIIQRISMHKIQIYRARQCLMELFRPCRRHIILIELSNLEFGFHSFFIPFEITAVHAVPLDQERTDRCEDHRFLVHIISLLKHFIEMRIKHLHLACKVCRIKGQLLCHQFMLHREEKHSYFKFPQLFQGRTPLPEAAERLHIEPDTVGTLLIKLLFQHPQSLTVDLIL